MRVKKRKLFYSYNFLLNGITVNRWGRTPAQKQEGIFFPTFSPQREPWKDCPEQLSSPYHYLDVLVPSASDDILPQRQPGRRVDHAATFSETNDSRAATTLSFQINGQVYTHKSESHMLSAQHVRFRERSNPRGEVLMLGCRFGIPGFVLGPHIQVRQEIDGTGGEADVWGVVCSTATMFWEERGCCMNSEACW